MEKQPFQQFKRFPYSAVTQAKKNKNLDKFFDKTTYSCLVKSR